MFIKLAKISLVLVYLVIIAGAVVRMTGSGMGCPDWPKCFGYYIPPTDREQLDWQPNQQYFKGQVIIVQENLKVAKREFISTKSYNMQNWDNYEKHDYAEFNVWHTWIEYINRLLGALSGLSILIMFLISFRNIGLKSKLVFWSFVTLCLLLFQAWLGATVVYSELLPARITIHMIVALVIVALLIYIISLSTEKKSIVKPNQTFHIIVIIGLLLSLVQIALGTQVRQFVDESLKLIGYQKELWLKDIGATFYIHRSFSILILLFNLSIWYINRKNKYNLDIYTNTLMIIIGLEIFTGVLMYYFDFPFLSQPLHLLIAVFLFSIQFNLLLRSNSYNKA